MSKNSSRVEQRALRLIDQILALDAENPHAIKGSALGLIKAAKKALVNDVKRRRDARIREILRKVDDKHGDALRDLS